nr:MAG TPA: hypothetical protein [Caudoviricetes sp.]
MSAPGTRRGFFLRSDIFLKRLQSDFDFMETT